MSSNSFKEYERTERPSNTPQQQLTIINTHSLWHTSCQTKEMSSDLFEVSHGNSSCIRVPSMIHVLVSNYLEELIGVRLIDGNRD
jgi:hypothetical protein